MAYSDIQQTEFNRATENLIEITWTLHLIHIMQIRRIKYAEQENASDRKLFTGKR